jgi:pilus assembly protein CpaB
MKSRRRIIGIFAATILALAGTVSLVGYVSSAKNDAVAQEALVDIYVVDAFIPKGADPATIRSSVSIEQVPARLKQDDAITDLDTVGDQVAAADLQAGDQLVAARLASEELVAKEVTDKVQISALLEAERAVGGALQKGDLVGVYLSFEPFEIDASGSITEPVNTETPDPETPDRETPDPETENTDQADSAAAIVAVEDSPGDESSVNDGPTKTANVSRLEFQHILVTNVQTINAPVSPADDSGDTGIAQVTGLQYVVTLALSPEQSERFVFATEFGHVWLSIDPATVTDDGTREVTLDNVYTVVKP